jgi:hypothetical protein
MLRLADFNHLNRQTFGVFQLFKARSGLRSSASAKRIENGYFVCLTAMLFSTYLAGGMFPFLQRDRAPMVPLWFAKSLTMASLIVAAPLVSWMLMRLLKSWRDAGRPEGLSETIAYLGVQSVSVVFSIFSFPLYAATLAIHYVEYHVLMFPRCLKSELNPNSTLDGWYRAFRSNRLVFYLVVMVLSGVVTVFRGITMSDSLPEPRKYLALVAIFDGLFVFHYFIEAFIWRFQDPFFRRTTAPLYFTPRVASS